MSWVWGFGGGFRGQLKTLPSDAVVVGGRSLIRLHTKWDRLFRADLLLV